MELKGMSKRYELIHFLRTYPFQFYNRVGRGGSAGDREASLMPVDDQDVRCFLILLPSNHKWLLGI